MAQTSPNPTVELITRLSQAVGVSGYQGAGDIHAVVTAELTPCTDQIERDRMGSIIGLKKGEGPTSRKIMIAAHLDEIGAIVTHLDQGFVRFTQVGGLDDRVLMGQEVVVHGQRDLPGIIGSIPPHLLLPGQANHEVDLTKMQIDVGLPARQLAQLVQVGDLISFVGPVTTLQNGLVSGKAMDNRASIAAMVLCLQELSRMRHSWDVYAVATADEEWGRFTGATTQAYAIQPDVALVMDVTFADVNDLEIKLGEGPVVSLGPSNHPALRQRMIEICERLELKYQSEIMPSGAGTDAFAIEVSRAGVPTLLISIPSRNMHTPVEMIDPNDVARAGRLLAHFIASLDEAFVETLIPE